MHQSNSDSSNTSGRYVKIEVPPPPQFVASSDFLLSKASEISGSMEGGLSSEKTWAVPGASFLQQKGFGWLMEVDDSEMDEHTSLLEELDIDPRDIVFKLRCVLFPVYGNNEAGYDRRMIRDSPDFWGPLVVVLLFAGISLYGQLRVVAWIVTMWIFGSLVIFLLARVLGGEVGYSQCLGVIGYSVLPLVVTGVATIAFHSFQSVALFVKLCGVLWATYSAHSLLCVQELQNKRLQLLYPIFLLYVYFFTLYLGV